MVLSVEQVRSIYCVHCDIKATNFCLGQRAVHIRNRQHVVKLIDAGHMLFLDPAPPGGGLACVTGNYRGSPGCVPDEACRAPPHHRENVHSGASDVYALGRVAFEVLHDELIPMEVGLNTEHPCRATQCALACPSALVRP